MKAFRIIISFILMIFTVFVLTACDAQIVRIQYGISSAKMYRCDVQPVYFELPENHGDMLVNLITTEVYGFASNYADAIATNDFLQSYGYYYSSNSEYFDVTEMALELAETGVVAGVIGYLDLEEDTSGEVVREISESISGYQVGHYYVEGYDRNKNVLFKGLIPEAKTILFLSDEVKMFKVYSVTEAGLDKYFPNGTTPANVAYENARELNSKDEALPGAPEAGVKPESDVTFSEYQLDYTDNEGYSYSAVLKISPWILSSNTDLLLPAWNQISSGEELPTINTWGFQKSGDIYRYSDNYVTGFESEIDDMYYAVGTITITNTTPGWDFTEEKAGYPKVALLTNALVDYDKKFIARVYTDEEQTSTLGVNIKALMTSNQWGPVPFVLAYAEEFNPNNPEGQNKEYLDKLYFAFGHTEVSNKDIITVKPGFYE